MRPIDGEQLLAAFGIDAGSPDAEERLIAAITRASQKRRGPGRPRINPRIWRQLGLRWRAFRRRHPSLSAEAALSKFLQQHGPEFASLRIRSYRALLNAARKGRDATFRDRASRWRIVPVLGMLSVLRRKMLIADPESLRMYYYVKAHIIGTMLRKRDQAPVDNRSL